MVEWIALAVGLIALAATIFIKPKTDTPKAATLSDFDLPTAEENRPIPVLFGTRMISGSNVVWYGDLEKEKLYM